MALALNPHVLARAQEEVDTIVGSNRIPTFDDEHKLPYIKAMIREVLRWRPTAAATIPHASVEVGDHGIVLLMVSVIYFPLLPTM